MNTELAIRNQDQAGASSSRLSPSDLIFLLYCYRWVLLAGLLLGLAGALVIFLSAPLIFRSEAKLLVRYVADTTVLDPGATGGRVMMPDVRGENIINSEVEIFSNLDSVEKVIERIGPERFAMGKTNGMERSRAMENILENLYVEVPRRSNIIKVYYDGPTPELSLRVLTELVEAYLNKHLQVHRSGAAYDFLSQQTDQSRARLAETEAELRKVKNEAGIGSAQESEAALMGRVAELKRTLGEGEAQLASARARMKVMEGMPARDLRLSLASRAATNQPTSDLLQERLLRLEKRRDELLAIYTEDSIPIQTVRAQIQAVRGIASEAPVTSNEAVRVDESPLFVPELAEVAGLDAQVASLRSQLEAAAQEAARLDQLKSRLDQLERTRQIQEDNYRSFSRSMEQARINDALDSGKISNISVVQPALLVAANYRPRLLANMALALGGTLALTLLLLVGFEWLPGRRVRRLKDIEFCLRLPALLGIPRAGREKKSPNHSDDQVNGSLKNTLPSALGPYGDALADRIIKAFGADLPCPCLLGLVGCREGAGVTTLATGVAVALARHGESRVLLLNAPSGSDKSPRLLGAASAMGGMDIRCNEKGRVTAFAHNLFVLGSNADSEPAELSLTRRWPELMQQIQDGGYRYVVVDLPAITPVSTSLRIASQLHATLLVVEANRDRISSLRTARDLLARSRVRVAGAVLNKVSRRIPEWLHAGP